MAGSGTNFMQSPVWGLVKSLRKEQPGIVSLVIDLDPGMTLEVQLEQILKDLNCSEGEHDIAYRGSQRFVARLTSDNLK